MQDFRKPFAPMTQSPARLLRAWIISRAHTVGSPARMNLTLVSSRIDFSPGSVGTAPAAHPGAPTAELAHVDVEESGRTPVRRPFERPTPGT